MLALHNILNGIWMINPDYASNYLPLVVNYLKGERQVVQQSQSTSDKPELSSKNAIKVAVIKNDGYQVDDDEYVLPIEAPENSMAIISIVGAITKYDQFCGPVGMKTISDLLMKCYSNSNIKCIVIKGDSGGGSGLAMRLLAETISLKNKPVGFFADDCADSAMYGIAVGCDYICANSTVCEVGSIGTYGTIIDYREQLKLMGINLIEIYATASTEKNKPFIDALNGKPEALRAIIDVYNENFLSLVENSRGDRLKSDRKVWGTGKTWFAPQALELGLIDGIDTFENFINYFNS